MRDLSDWAPYHRFADVVIAQLARHFDRAGRLVDETADRGQLDELETAALQYATVALGVARPGQSGRPGGVRGHVAALSQQAYGDPP